MTDMQSIEEGCSLASGKFDCLLREVKNLEKAHRKCRGINKKLDTLLNVLILLSSAGVTSLESLLDLTKNSYQVMIAKIILSGFCTFAAGLNMTFNNSQKAESHHFKSREYMELGIKIMQAQLIKDQTQYPQLLTQFSDIRKESIGLFGWVRRKYSVS